MSWRLQRFAALAHFAHASLVRACRFAHLFDLLSAPSLLVSVWSPPGFISFLAVHRDIFHVLPRSIIAKEGAPLPASATVPDGVVAEWEDSESFAIGAGEGAAAIAPAHQSRRQAKKRKQMERNAQRNAMNGDQQGPPQQQHRAPPLSQWAGGSTYQPPQAIQQDQ